LSGCIGKGDLNHNNRSIITANVDKERIADDIIICQHSLKQLYHNLFDEALEEFNAKQTRKDRKIPNYQEHIWHSRQEKEFYEVLLQVGNRDDTGIDSDMCKEIAAVLEEYARSFEERNPHLKLFNTVIHMDESTPHLHLDFVPVTDEKRKNGMRVRNSLTGALRQQGCEGKGIGRMITINWLEQEKAHIGQLMLERGIEWVKLEETKEGLPLKDYKLKKRQEELDAADKLIEMKLEELGKVEGKLSVTEDKIKSAESELTEKKQEIADSKTELSEMTDKIDEKKQEYRQAKNDADAILNLIPNYEKDEKAMQDFELAKTALGGYTRSAMVIMRSKDEINAQVNELCRILKTALNKIHKYSLTIGELRKMFGKVVNERDDFADDNKRLISRNRELSNDYSSLKRKYDTLSVIYQQIERIAPDAVAQAKRVIEEQRNHEQQRQAEYQPTKKKKSWDIGL
jgi:hypothetical protein